MANDDLHLLEEVLWTYFIERGEGELVMPGGSGVSSPAHSEPMIIKAIDYGVGKGFIKVKLQDNFSNDVTYELTEEGQRCLNFRYMLE